MPKHAGSTDHLNRVVVTPEITRVFWSRKRVRNGSDVRLFVETRFVPDGTPLKIAIFEDGADEGLPDEFFAEIEEQELTNNCCLIDYKLSWDTEAVGPAIAREGAELECYFRVKLEGLGLEARSALLYVDLGSFHFSA